MPTIRSMVWLPLICLSVCLFIYLLSEVSLSCRWIARLTNSLSAGFLSSEDPVDTVIFSGPPIVSSVAEGSVDHFADDYKCHQCLRPGVFGCCGARHKACSGCGEGLLQAHLLAMRLMRHLAKSGIHTLQIIKVCFSHWDSFHDNVNILFMYVTLIKYYLIFILLTFIFILSFAISSIILP